jgi:mono/diheme cytochrome c family protein
MKRITIYLIPIILTSLLSGEDTKDLNTSKNTKEPLTGKQVFEKYCWGCHHQTAVAFGPPFSEIASKRSKEEIQAMITDPASVSKVFGYKRNAMPPFKLTPKELELISEYILSYKHRGDR